MRHIRRLRFIDLYRTFRTRRVVIRRNADPSRNLQRLGRIMRKTFIARPSITPMPLMLARSVRKKPLTHRLGGRQAELRRDAAGWVQRAKGSAEGLTTLNETAKTGSMGVLRPRDESARSSA